MAPWPWFCLLGSFASVDSAQIPCLRLRSTVEPGPAGARSGLGFVSVGFGGYPGFDHRYTTATEVPAFGEPSGYPGR